MLVKEKIALLSADNLAYILSEVCRSHPEVSYQVEDLLNALITQQKDAGEAIKQSLNIISQDKKDLDEQKVELLMQQLRSLRKRILTSSAENMLEFIVQFLHLESGIMDRLDPSMDNQDLYDIFNAAVVNLNEILIKQKTPLNQKVDIVLALSINDTHATFDEIIMHCKEALTEDGLMILKDRLENALNDRNVEEVKIGLKQIADCLQDEDLFIHACTFTGSPTTIDRMEIALRLTECKEDKEALKWLVSATMPDDLEWADLYKKAMLQSLENLGDYAKAQEYRLTWFEADLDPVMYDQLFQKTRLHLRPLLHKDAIAKATTFHDPMQALSFLNHLRDPVAIASFVYLKINQLDGSYDSVLNTAAELLRKNDQLAATLLYRKMIEDVLSQTKVNLFHSAAKKLVLCAALSPNVKDWHTYQQHADYIKNIVAQYPEAAAVWTYYQKESQQKNIKK
ncbi:hypothetical protein EBR43_03515 [bacterium]|nr:hypothetical protein [bacterium]